MVPHKFTQILSEDEKEARDDYLREIYIKLEFLKDEIREECEEIGGHFRGPGMMKATLQMAYDMLENLEGSHNFK